MKIDQKTGEIIAMVRGPFNFDPDDNSNEHATTNDEPTLTQQNFKDECDINNILEKFGVTGELPTNIRQPVSTDFIEAMSFHDAQNAIIEAKQNFMELPAAVRAKFDNDPGAFIDYMEAPLDDAGREERAAFAIKHGLATRKETPPEAVSPGTVTSSTTTVPGDAPKA